LWEETGDRQHDDYRSYTYGDDRENRSEEAGNDAGLKCAQLV